MSQADRKVVQTELTEAEYDRLRLAAEEEGLTLKEALRRAAEEYVESKEGFDPDDPFFTYHDRVDASGDAETDAVEMDEDVYGAP